MNPLLTPRVSVVVATIDRLDAVELCLDRLMQTIDVAIETIVVVGPGGDLVAEQIAKRHDVAALLRNPERNLARSRNMALSVARGEFDLSGLHQRRQQRHLVHFCGVAGELERRDPAIRLQRPGLFLGHAVGRRQVRQQRLSRSARQRQQQRLRRGDLSGDVHEHHVCRWRGVLSLRHL